MTFFLISKYRQVCMGVTVSLHGGHSTRISYRKQLAPNSGCDVLNWGLDVIRTSFVYT